MSLEKLEQLINSLAPPEEIQALIDEMQAANKAALNKVPTAVQKLVDEMQAKADAAGIGSKVHAIRISDIDGFEEMINEALGMREPTEEEYAEHRKTCTKCQAKWEAEQKVKADNDYDKSGKAAEVDAMREKLARKPIGYMAFLDGEPLTGSFHPVRELVQEGVDKGIKAASQLNGMLGELLRSKAPVVLPVYKD